MSVVLASVSNEQMNYHNVIIKLDRIKYPERKCLD